MLRMATLLCYYSRDQRSVSAAAKLAAEIKDVRAVSIQIAIEAFPEYEVEQVGIISPAYYWGLPSIVSRFLDRIPSRCLSEAFAVIICDYNKSNVLQEIAGRLSAKKIRLRSGFLVREYDLQPA